MALACRPKLLIADEPTTALDVTIQAQIIDLINELKDEVQTAVIIITHDLGVVASMADHVAVMYAGYVVENGTVATIFRSPQHPYTQALLGAIPRLRHQPERLTTIEGAPPSLTANIVGCPFAPRCALFEPQCEAKNPPLLPFEPGHTAACWVTHREAERVTSGANAHG
jgi:oligopeptide/dipeptide ABC transporter ATP-binding protein